MKKSWISLSFALSLLLTAPSAQADRPDDSISLHKDSVSIAEKQAFRMPLLKDIRLQDKNLPSYNTTVIVHLTIAENGLPTKVCIEKSSGSAALDTIALETVRSWEFAVFTLHGKPIAVQTRVPIRFVSDTAAQPAAPKNPYPLSFIHELASLLNDIHGGIYIPILFHLDAEGNQEAKADITKPDGWTYSDDQWNTIKKHIEESVKDWKFTSAKDPDGNAIRSDFSYILPIW